MSVARDEITYREIEDGNVEICRDLCNALMAHQADRGVLHPEVLRAMSFDNRLKPSYEGAEEKQIITAFDGGKPIGYVYSSAGLETEASKTARPAWAAGLPGIRETGFYPDWLPLPGKIGCLNNLYVLPEYRGRHIASALCDKAMSWLRSVTDIKYIFVYVSNGNNSVIDFYKNYGFEYSHDVFGGFIIAYYQKVQDR
jgi:ribosomal protein S18 acetylase RimI-like enzyme